MKRTELNLETSHSLTDKVFRIETEVINSRGSRKSIGKNRRRYAA